MQLMITHTGCTRVQLFICHLSLPGTVLGSISHQLLETLGAVAKVDGVTIETTPSGGKGREGGIVDFISLQNDVM